MQSYSAPAALKSFATYIKQNADNFVTTEPDQLTPVESADRKRRIEELAAATDKLSKEDSATYAQFETIVGALHKLGMYPTNTLLGAVARSFGVAT